MRSKAVGAALLFAFVACAGPRRIRIRPAVQRDLRGVVFLPFASSRTDSFFDAEGRPCAPFKGEVRDFFAGWQSGDQDPICDHDTLDHGTRPALLELRWRGKVPADGAFDLISGGYSVGAWGRVVARGSHYGDYLARARLELEVQSAHCRAEWSVVAARAAVTGSFSRAAEFTGWFEIPDTRVAACVAGDELEVRLRLLGEANRGRVEVDAFGFSTLSAEELNRMFGLKPASATPGR